MGGWGIACIGTVRRLFWSGLELELTIELTVVIHNWSIKCLVLIRSTTNYLEQQREHTHLCDTLVV